MCDWNVFELVVVAVAGFIVTAGLITFLVGIFMTLSDYRQEQKHEHL